MSPESWIDILDLALGEKTGVGLICHDREGADRARQRLYALRLSLREEGVSKYDSLSLSISPFSSEILYIYHQESSHDDSGQPAG